MTHAPLLVEIGCEEIPARMIRSAAEDFASRVAGIVKQSGLECGPASIWSGPRRIAVRLERVEGRQEDSDRRLLGPPAAVAFDADGSPTRAAAGFASKHGIDSSELEVVETERGPYAGFTSRVVGRTIGEILAAELPRAVEGMSFPKTMRWGSGEFRWVRPVHWLVALHGPEALPIRLLGVDAGRRSAGHRFLQDGDVEIDHPDRYVARMERACVLVDPEIRGQRLERLLLDAAASLNGRVVEDPHLLREVSDLVEWPGVAAGQFDAGFLELPRELLITTLRHHQKCFALQSEDGTLLPAFLAVANTDRDPAGHIRRGNEWVVGGRLEDAKFFWREDRKRPLAARSEALGDVMFHPKSGSFADKAERLERIAASVAERVGLAPESVEHCRRGARLAKNDLVTGTVGEFPELQGVVGGLMLEADGDDPAVARAVYSHYRPLGASDVLPESDESCVVAVSDKLDNLAELIRAGAEPTGSRDPFGLRRAANGLFRIVVGREWPLSLADLEEFAGPGPELSRFLGERLQHFLRETGFTTNEIQAVMRPRIDVSGHRAWPLCDIAARLRAIGTVRQREDFAHLVDLTKRVDNILTRNEETFAGLVARADEWSGHSESSAPAVELLRRIEDGERRAEDEASEGRYLAAVDTLSEFIEPVERFFDDVLVIDEGQPAATHGRLAILLRLRTLLTRDFDIRELAGQAERRT